MKTDTAWFFIVLAIFCACVGCNTTEVKPDRFDLPTRFERN